MKIENNTPVKTVLTISVGFGIIYLITGYSWMLYSSIAIGLLGLISSKLAKLIDWVWMKIAHILSLIVPKAVLTLVFFVILFPISLLAKLFSNKDALQLKNNKDSFWVDRTHPIEKSSLEKLW